ncbi:uncharacterized protein LOC132193855 [Neocloeon triangulifer]|uniref:uncharacterized protein LOC132193855 n=1 Tax=Neocloeon triangulifer TaxID=2078957 RepID=UPI00286ED20B|nr:uncharacterized protein LOC132193855 [Neocloeon triangulifer]
MRRYYLFILLAYQSLHSSSATFDFPTFDGAKPLMSALGSMQQFFFGGGGPGRVVKSASSPESAYASATVGYGTILKNPAPLVKSAPYGPPRPPLRRPARPLARPVNKYAQFKGGYYPKFKPQPPGTYEKLKPAVVEHKQLQGSKEYPLPPHKHHQPYEYTRNQVLYTSYTTAPEESTKSNAVIVQQSVRPPIHIYQQPHVATSHQVSNLNVKAVAPVVHQHHHRSDNLVDFSRPDPVFTAASMGSDWKPISSPVNGRLPERRNDVLVHKQVEAPPTIKRQHDIMPYVTIKKPHIDRSDHSFIDEEPSEEVVSAVVFVKKTNDD